MFRAKTLFVVGAGASFEVGLPVGTELLEQIVAITNIKFETFGRQISGDPNIVQALKILLDEGGEVKRLNDHIRAGWQLAKSAQQALSIDNVIDALEDPEIELIGKLGIVKAILKAESASNQFRINQETGEQIDLTKFKKTWYDTFTKLLTEGVKKSEIGTIFQNVEIINFNYDRCLEHYLPYSLSEYYGVSLGDIHAAMRSLTVHRPYGLAGRLPWQAGTMPSVGFGEGNAQQLAEVAQQIRTFTERVEEGEELEAMRASVAAADRIVFLGFAFHRQNVELISSRIQDHTEIVATAYGISKSDKSVIEDELAKAFEFDDEVLINNGRADLTPLSCDAFFREYWRTLTAGKSDRERSAFPAPFESGFRNPFG